MFDFALSQQHLSDVLSKQVFFVVGVAKSGTTWLQKVLDGHPSVSCNGEGHFCDNLLPLLRDATEKYRAILQERNQRMYKGDGGYPLLNGDHLNSLFAFAVAMVLGEQSRGKSVLSIGEKTPGHIRYMTQLSELFPRAKFLHIVRDGRDVVVSGWLHNLRVDEKETRKSFGDFSVYVRHVAGIWNRQIHMARAFAAAHPERYLEFNYEELHRDPNPIIERIFRFIGVDSSPAVVELSLQAGAFEQLSRGRKRGEEDLGSHYRKGVVGDWKSHFDQASINIFMQQAGALLRELGYE